MSVRPSVRSPRRPRARSRSGATTLTRVGAILASAALSGAAVAADASPRAAHLDLVLTRTERMVGAWQSPQHVLETSHRLARVPARDVGQLRGDAPQAPVPVFRFDIAPGPLPDALQQFEQITGVAVTVAGAVVGGLTSGGVVGTLTVEQALTRLLAGSSLSHRFESASTVTLEVRVGGDAVEVSAAVPRIESTKYTAPLVETPQSIQVIPRAVIEEQGATTLSEVLRNVPGITMQAGEGGGASNTSGDMFNMRGFPASNSLFVDGVRDDGLIARDVYNLEQVEVFSGPTGSDVGRTNAAGYVNLTTKAPGLRSSRSGSVTYGSGTNVRGTVDLNQPLATGTPGTFAGNAAFRVNALWQDGGVPGRDEVARRSRSIAPSLALGLGTPTRLSISGQVMSQDNLPDYGLPQAASPIGPLTSTGVVSPTPVDQSNYYGSPDYDYDRAVQGNVTVRFERDLRPGTTLRNQTRYNTTSREAVISSIGSPNSYDAATNAVSISRQVNYRDNDVLSNQTSLVARVQTGRIRHDLSVGLEISAENYHAPGMTGAGSRAPVDVSHPDVFSPVVGMDVVPSGSLNDGETETVAFYLFDGVDLGTRVRLNGGLRVERYSTSSHSINNAGTVTDLDRAGTLVSGKAGVLYRLGNTGNLYLSYGSSLTPPGSTNFLLNANPTNANNPNVDPQQSVNVEVGTKWDLARGRLLLSGALFHTRNTNVIFVVDNTAVPAIFNQDDRQRVRGGAFGLVGRILPAWDVNLNVQYLDSEVISQNGNTHGHRLTLTPELSGSLWTTVRLAHGVRIGGGLTHTDDVFVNSANTLVVPGYSLVGGLVEVPIGPRLLVRLNINNLTDQGYIRSINNNGGRYNPGNPRSFLLTTLIRF